MGTATVMSHTVMSQAGRPTSSSSKGTLTLSVASVCSDHMGLPKPALLWRWRWRKGDPSPRLRREFSRTEPKPLLFPILQMGPVVPHSQVAPRALCPPQLPLRSRP